MQELSDITDVNNKIALLQSHVVDLEKKKRRKSMMKHLPTDNDLQEIKHAFEFHTLTQSSPLSNSSKSNKLNSSGQISKEIKIIYDSLRIINERLNKLEFTVYNIQNNDECMNNDACIKNDVLDKFLNDYYMLTNDDKDYESFSTLYFKLIMWYSTILYNSSKKIHYEILGSGHSTSCKCPWTEEDVIEYFSNNTNYKTDKNNLYRIKLKHFF